ncbi:beta family protein [Pararoseomonas sp. SCSIO 73927]|uniref:beta family protein n=1 Tax=Pararoseomonas sp. SCSIO 73927 TaxID=3114537 RepID=UPI0030D587CE
MSSTDDSYWYYPALRAKAGEFDGLNALSRDIADRIRPRFLIPPPKEIDSTLGRAPRKDEIIGGIGNRIARSWAGREALVDPRYLLEDFGDAEIDSWLPRIFEIGSRVGAKMTPVFAVDKVDSLRLSAFKSAIAASGSDVQVALRIPYDFDNQLIARSRLAISDLGLEPSRCVALIDLCGATLDLQDAVVGFVQDRFSDLQDAAPWRQIIFQASNFPETNPAKKSEIALVRRAEWEIWKKVASPKEGLSSGLIFGDYGADYADLKLGNNRARPIRHHRYTTSAGWYVVREDDINDTSEAMTAVCDRIVKSGHFAGRGFSEADAQIFRQAHRTSKGPGRSSDWRAVNTTHHITHVVRELGKLNGVDLPFGRTDASEQLELI